MRKSILVGIVAALMLFAFTACENNAPTTPLYGKTVESIRPIEYPDYVVYGSKLISGDFNAADVKLSVVFDDNSTATYTGDELDLSAPATWAAGTNQFSVSYGPNGNSEFTVLIPAYEAEITGLDVTGAKASAIAIGTSGTPASMQSGEGLKVVFTYNGNETISKDFSKDYINYTFYITQDFDLPADGLASDEIKEGSTYKFDPSKKFHVTENGAFADIDIIGEWTITFASDVPVVESVKFERSEKNEIFAVTGAKDTLAALDYEVTLNIEDDDPVTLTEIDVDTSDDGWRLTYPDYEKTFAFTEKDQSINLKIVAEYVKDGKVLVSKDVATTKVTAIADYPATFTVDENSAAMAEDEVAWAADMDIDAKYFTFGVETWASGKSDYSTDPMTIDADDFEGITHTKKGATGSVTVQFKYTGEGSKVNTQLAETTITIDAE